MKQAASFSNPTGWRYSVILCLVSLPVLFYTLLQAIKLKQWRYLKQRLGFQYSTEATRPVWVHAASVGEALAITPLVKKILSHYPDIPIAFSTMTPTGAQIVKQQFGSAVTHYYLPFDWRAATRRFVSALNPRCALIMETELWPNLYRACIESNVEIIIVNGRLSARTLSAKPWIKDLYSQSLKHVTSILARSQRDADAFLELGAQPFQVKVIGNIKFAAAKLLSDIKPLSPSLSRPYVLVASTHANEELHITEQWLKICETNTDTNHLLVIAPRHPKRSAAILKQLDTMNINIAVRSKNEDIDSDTAVYLADTLGELASFMVNAEIIIMGGSFIPHGGQNILEPAILGKTIIFGPYMDNFIDEAEGLLKQQAAIQADDYTDLLEIIPILLKQPAKRNAYGDRAALFMNNKKNILDNYFEEINKLLTR